MARFLRSQPRSSLRPPTVVAPAVVFQPPSTAIRISVSSSPYARVLRLKPGSRLAAPAAVGPAAIFRPPAISLQAVEARQSWTQRKVQSKLAPPTTLAAAVAFLAYPVRVVFLQRNRIGRRTITVGRPPMVVSQAVLFRRPMAALTAVSTGLGLRRRAPKSKLSPPITLAAAVAFLAYPVRVILAKRNIPPRVHWVGVFPAIVDPGTVFRAPLTALVAVKRLAVSRRRGHSRLYPPTTLQAAVAFLAYPVRVVLARRLPTTQWKTRSDLSPPTVVNAAAVFRAPVAALSAVATAAGLRRRAPRSRLSPPAIIAAAVGFLAAPVRIYLARRLPTTQWTTKSKLSAPAVIGAAAIFRRPVVALTAIVTRAGQIKRGGRWSLRPPNLAPPFVARAVQLLLAAHASRLRYQKRTRSTLGKPTVLAPAVIFRPVVRLLVARTSLERVRRPGKVKIYPPVLETIAVIFGFFRRGRPRGPDPGSPDSAPFDDPNLGGPDPGTPGPPAGSD